MRGRPAEFFTEGCLDFIETCPLIEFEDDEDEREGRVGKWKGSGGERGGLFGCFCGGVGRFCGGIG